MIQIFQIGNRVTNDVIKKGGQPGIVIGIELWGFEDNEDSYDEYDNLNNQFKVHVSKCKYLVMFKNEQNCTVERWFGDDNICTVKEEK